MEVQVAETGPCSRTLTITVPPASVQQHLDEVYKSASQQVQLKGFRPGKVPRKLVEQRWGESILAEAKEQLVNRFLGDACRDQQIQPIGRVSVDDYDKLEVKIGTELKFTAKVDVRPQLEIKNAKGLVVERYETEATDTDVDNALAEVANQKRSMKKIDEPAQDGDFVKADLKFQDAGGTIVLERKNSQLNTRIPIAGATPEAFAKALAGAKPGDQIALDITFPDNFEKDALRGQAGQVHIAVHEVLRITPAAIDDALAKGLEFGDLAALKDDLRTRIASEKVRVGKMRQEEQCLQALATAHPFDLPGSLVEEQQVASLNTFGNRLKQQGGISDDEIRKKLEESKDEAYQDAQRRVRLFFLIEAVARQHKIFVTETDIDAELRNIAQANSKDGQQVTAAQVREYLDKNKQLGELRLGLLERKVRDFLRENAAVVDKKAS
ncbi:MAG: trigger factor [Planctomycetes bacterium]|nr:trigger factor [Planctomycetota bacterium]